LSGSMDDNQNYRSVRKNLVIMRSGLNLIHIYADPKKRKEVNALALIMTPGPEEIITQLVIAAAWAAAEAENDLRLLEKQKRVALFKNDKNWALDLEGIMDGTKQDGVIEPQNTDGLNYEQYLRVLLFLQNKETQLLRCMDLIQLNMKANYNRDFDLNEYYGGFQFEAEVQGRSFSYIQTY